jgi:prolyl-tRNA editing enzyme YbaK/EbsC (Cys-tRNA(Pro) deacylase)
MTGTTLGRLRLRPAAERPDLLAEPVSAVIASVPEALVTEIDPDLADTAALCDAYDVGMDMSANCVVVAGTRAGVTRYAACVVLATTRADVNGLVRKRLDVRKASFAPMDDAVARSGMEYGGITPVGLRGLAAAGGRAVVAATGRGGQWRASLEAVLPGAALARLPQAEVLPGLGRA